MKLTVVRPLPPPKKYPNHYVFDASDYVTVSHVEWRGTWGFGQLISPHDELALALLANSMEKKR